MRGKVNFKETVIIYSGSEDRITAIESQLCNEDKETAKIYKLGINPSSVKEEDEWEEEEVIVSDDLDSIFCAFSTRNASSAVYDDEEEEGYDSDSPRTSIEKRCMEVFSRQFQPFESALKRQDNSSAETAQNSSFESETTTNPDESLDGIRLLGHSTS